MNTIEVARDGAVAGVFLNRPELRNAFNAAVIEELTQTFTELGADPRVRVILLGGHGKAFCAGADLSWMRDMASNSWDENRADAQRLADMLWAVYQCPVPVLARIHGDCYAGGVGLAAACDIIVASDEAHFCLSEAKLGLLPATIGPYVIRALGEQAARRYFVTAERFSAAEAHRLGMVHELTRPEQIDTRMSAIIGAIITNGPAAVKACKALVQDLAGRPLTPELRADTARRIADIRASDEGREGVQAFLGKRPAAWLMADGDAPA